MASMFNLRYLARIQAFEKTPGPFRIELIILCFDAEKEPVLARPSKACDIEGRVVGHGEPVGD